MVTGFGWQFWRHGALRETLTSSLRITLALVGVMAGCLTFDQPQAIIPLLLGIIASGLAETDDNWRGRLVAQLITLLCFALIVSAVKVSFANPAALMLVFAASAFFLTLLGALGDHYRTIATATLIMSIYAALALQPHEGRLTAGGQEVLLLAGAAWHGLISILWAALLPRLPIEQNLARLYDALGRYLELKSKMFEPIRGLDREQRRLALALHNGRVVDALNAAKESLFSHRHQSPAPGWLETALHQFFVAQDVHERTSSSHESYDLLADTYFHSDVLYRCERVLAALGSDCLSLAAAIRNRQTWTRDGATPRAVEDLAAAIAHAAAMPSAEQPVSTESFRAHRALRALATNLGAMSDEVAGVLRGERHRMPTDTALQDTQPRALRQFGDRLRAQLTLQSPIMRHAIRLALALAAGYGLMLATGDSYGFWIPLTVVFVCQPRWAATLSRFVERIGGTLLGLLIGWAVLKLFPDPLTQSLFVVIAAVLFFIFRASRYALATAAITAFVLLSFNQVGNGFDLIVPRLLDTLAGSLIAGLAVWLILPSWNALRLPALAADVLRSQSRYLEQIIAQYGEVGKHDNLPYRIARRAAHNADAALSGALTAALREPRHVRHKLEAGTRFLVLSHTLLNYLSALGAHRSARLEADDVAIDAANRLRQSMENVAQLLGAGQATPHDGTTDASEILQSLTAPQNNEPDEPEFHRILRAQLALALNLLPAVRASAEELSAKN